ncbi:hypothetical protein O181_022815 [Austropuccinia psidii MF-1]|uniref:Uncharacterized protein n=1 Tax=Austropuccinia psidii MF-1 TaxID=1389203 RepID=A0A9Q3GYH3_9BASI|nr:hypothetical protein [Austropuccinia psidii MF-1]
MQGSTTAGNTLEILTRAVELLVPVFQPKNTLGRWPVSPDILTHMREKPRCQSGWISNILKRNRGECLRGSRVTAGTPSFQSPIGPRKESSLTA